MSQSVSIILPAKNEADLEDLPEAIRSELKIHLVEYLGEALAHSLRGAVLVKGQLKFE